MKSHSFVFVATQNEISQQTEICFFRRYLLAILPALIWVLVRLTKFVLGDLMMVCCYLSSRVLALCQFEDVLQIRQQQKPMQLSLI